MFVSVGKKPGPTVSGAVYSPFLDSCSIVGEKVISCTAYVLSGLIKDHKENGKKVDAERIPFDLT